MHWLAWTAIGIALITATILPLLIYRNQEPSPLHIYTILFTLSILLIPWFILRRMQIAAWLTFALHHLQSG